MKQPLCSLLIVLSLHSVTFAATHRVDPQPFSPSPEAQQDAGSYTERRASCASLVGDRICCWPQEWFSMAPTRTSDRPFAGGKQSSSHAMARTKKNIRFERYVRSWPGVQKVAIRDLLEPGSPYYDVFRIGSIDDDGEWHDEDLVVSGRLHRHLPPDDELEEPLSEVELRVARHGYHRAGEPFSSPVANESQVDSSAVSTRGHVAQTETYPLYDDDIWVDEDYSWWLSGDEYSSYAEPVDSKESGSTVASAVTASVRALALAATSMLPTPDTAIWQAQITRLYLGSTWARAADGSARPQPNAQAARIDNQTPVGLLDDGFYFDEFEREIWSPARTDGSEPVGLGLSDGNFGDRVDVNVPPWAVPGMVVLQRVFLLTVAQSLDETAETLRAISSVLTVVFADVRDRPNSAIRSGVLRQGRRLHYPGP